MASTRTWRSAWSRARSALRACRTRATSTSSSSSASAQSRPRTSRGRRRRPRRSPPLPQLWPRARRASRRTSSSPRRSSSTAPSGASTVRTRAHTHPTVHSRLLCIDSALLWVCQTTLHSCRLSPSLPGRLGLIARGADMFSLLCATFKVFVFS